VHWRAALPDSTVALIEPVGCWSLS
jgi:hypothetical protein